MNHPSFRRELSKPRPLLAMALCVIAGILLADHYPQGRVPAYLGFPALLVGSAIALWKRHWIACLPMAFSLAILAHCHHLQNTRHHPWHQWLQQQSTPKWVEVEGIIEQPLRRSLPGFDVGEALFRATRFHTPDPSFPAAQPARFALRLESGAALKAGHYRLTGWMQLAPPTDNPGQFDKRDYDLRLGLIGHIKVAHLLASTPYRWDLKSRLIETSERCRTWIKDTLSQHLPADAPERTVLLAMTLGTSDTATPEMQIPFRLSGTLHIFAVSGLHVAIIGMILWFVLRCLGVSRGMQPPLLIPLLFGYTFITGLPPSAVRSAIMASVLLLGMTSNRKSDLLNTLGASALILFLIDTDQLFTPGFQLSFGVLGSIAVFNECFSRPLRPFTEPDPFIPKNLLTLPQQIFWKMRQSFAGTLTVSASAWIGSIPLVLYHFHTLTPIGLIANLFLVPWSVIVLSLTITRLLFAGSLFSFLQPSLAWISHQSATATLWMANFFASIPGGHVYVPSIDLLPRTPAQLTVLRLPAGDAANHLRIGNIHWLLDAGSIRQFPFTLQPFLHYQGINRIDHLLISHADGAHYSAASSLITHYGLRQITAPFKRPSIFDFPPDHWHQIHATKDLVITPDSPLIPHIEILFPPPNWRSSRADDHTIVARIHIGPHRILWCNDAGFTAEKHLLATLPGHALQSELIIRNQHADDYSMLPEFIQVVQPRVIISSHAQFPIEQQIRPSLRETCHRLGVQLFDQSQTGAVIIDLWPERMRLTPFRGNQTPVTLP
jgi:competence protein ComEC